MTFIDKKRFFSIPSIMFYEVQVYYHVLSSTSIPLYLSCYTKCNIIVFFFKPFFKVSKSLLFAYSI